MAFTEDTLPSLEAWKCFVRRLEERYGLREVPRASWLGAQRPDFLSHALQQRVAYLLPAAVCDDLSQKEARLCSISDQSSTEAKVAVPGAIIAAYVGRNLQGPSGGVHGGAIASLLDASIGMATNPRSDPDGYVTAQLVVNYRQIVPLGSYVLALAYVHDREPARRKCYGMSRLVDAGALAQSTDTCALQLQRPLEAARRDTARERVYADATALFVRQRHRPETHGERSLQTAAVNRVESVSGFLGAQARPWRASL
jgi:acyl-coenzyme A thioesterase PaaI-like protein